MKYTVKDHRDVIKDDKTFSTIEEAEKWNAHLMNWRLDARTYIEEVPENDVDKLTLENKELRLELWRMEGMLDSRKEEANEVLHIRELLEQAVKDMTVQKSSVAIHYWGSKIKQILAEGIYVPPAQVKAADFSQLTGDEINKLRNIIEHFDEINSE